MAVQHSFTKITSSQGGIKKVLQDVPWLGV